MRLVDFETFLRMPAGTIFAPYTPCLLEKELAIKVDEGCLLNCNLRDSYIFNGVMALSPWLGDTALYAPGDQEEAGFKIYDGDTNDYRDYKMFLVFEKDDVDKLIQVLEWAKNKCEGDLKC